MNVIFAMVSDRSADILSDKCSRLLGDVAIISNLCLNETMNILVVINLSV